MFRSFFHKDQEKSYKDRERRSSRRKYPPISLTSRDGAVASTSSDAAEEVSLPWHIQDVDAWLDGLDKYDLISGTSLKGEDGLKECDLYSETPLKGGEIRTLLLHLGDGDRALTGTLETQRLEPFDPQTPLYGAVSFEWGEEQYRDQGTVVINGRLLAIPEGLEDALHAIRKSAREEAQSNRTYSEAATATMRLWVDAICINQEDEDEKKLQIQMMGTIFQRAHPLFIWLGNSNETDKLAVETVRALSTPLFRSVRAKLKDHPNPLYSDPDPRDSRWDALDALLGKSYFDRSWVIQEIVQASTDDLRVMCGSDVVQWNDIRIAVHLLKTHEWPDVWTNSWLRELELPIDSVRDKFQKLQTDFSGNLNVHCSLDSNLFEFRERLCLPPDDKIWSIRSICTDLGEHEMLPKVGEQLSTGQLYLEATKLALRNCTHLDVLSLCRQYNTEIQRPSWVPDYWSYAHYDRPELLVAQRLTSNGLRYSSSSDSKPYVRITEIGRCILKGFEIARVRAVVSVPVAVGPCPRRLQSTLQYAQLYLQCFDFLESEQNAWKLRHFVASPSSSAESEDMTDHDYRRSRQLLDFCRQIVSSPFGVDQTSIPSQIWNDFVAWKRLQTGRCLAIVDGDHWAQVPLDTQCNDSVILVQGARVPFVSRVCPTDPRLRSLVGECRLQGAMDGGMWQRHLASRVELEFN